MPSSGEIPPNAATWLRRLADAIDADLVEHVDFTAKIRNTPGSPSQWGVVVAVDYKPGIDQIP